jgi:hypothetical protein
MLTIWAIVSPMTQAQAPKARLKPADKDTAIDPQAVSALNKMSSYLKTLKTFKINSEASTDELVDTNMKVQKNRSSEISIELPNRAYAHIRGDEKDVELIYDGQTLTVFSKKQNYYAATPAPPTVARAVDVIRARYGITFPLADFIRMATGENLLQGIIAAGNIGTSWIDGVECDHVAVRQPEVDWQVWIERSETPVPRRYVITSKKEVTQPQYIANIAWDLSPSISESIFTFTPPPGAERIKFGRVRDVAQTPQKRQSPAKQK